MTLGILKIAAVLEQEGYIVEMLDLSGYVNYLEVVKAHLLSTSSVIFGITSTTPQLPAASQIAATIRNFNPCFKRILGGPHITLVNAAYKREKKLGQNGRAHIAMKQLEESFDVLVAGDGEISIFEAIEDNAPKLIDVDSPTSTGFLTDNRLAKLPFPARHLVDVSSYHYSIEGVPALSLIAQLGCPFACGFCGGRESPMLRRIRTRSSESIVAEMVHMHKTYGINGFMLYDDELNVNKEMVPLMEMIAKTQRDLRAEWRLRGFIKSQLFTDEQANAMYGAGFRWILTGFESGSERILQNINKKSTRAENTRCVEIARRARLKVKALMSVGHPGESMETIHSSREWLLETKPDDFDVTNITVYPGTPYYDHAIPCKDRENTWVYTYEPNGDKLYQLVINHSEIADYYKGDPNGGYKSYVYTDYLCAKDLVSERDRLEADVRKILNIPFNQSGSRINFEHSMGQSSVLPKQILNVTNQ